MTRKRFLLLYAAAVPATLAAAHLAYGGPAVLAVAIDAILLLVAHFDNHTGSCLLLTVVLLVVIGILCALLMLTAVVAIR